MEIKWHFWNSNLKCLLVDRRYQFFHVRAGCEDPAVAHFTLSSFACVAEPCSGGGMCRGEGYFCIFEYHANI